MERLVSPILSLGLIFVTLTAGAAPKGESQDYALRTTYVCQANGVLVQNKKQIVSDGHGVDEVEFVARAGRNQALTFGDDQEYMIWPRVANGTFDKSLNVLTREKSGVYKIIQEIDLGDSQKTKTNVSMNVKGVQGDPRHVSCRVEMEWIKKSISRP